VVASEVRSLAQRSATAAKEIKALIDDSVAQVDAGGRLVQAGTTMGEVVDSVRRVSHIVGEISMATQEQRAGIEQVNHAITHMDETTQQNAALVEQAAAAAQSLQDQSQRLRELVGVFRLRRCRSHSRPFRRSSEIEDSARAFAAMQCQRDDQPADGGTHPVGRCRRWQGRVRSARRRIQAGGLDGRLGLRRGQVVQHSLAACGSLVPTTTPTENGVSCCALSGMGPMMSMPLTGLSSEICCRPTSASPRAITSPTGSAGIMRPL
jgi:hypothetical protein